MESPADLIEVFNKVRKLEAKRGGSMFKAYRMSLGLIGP